jgi:hypothetical protein
LIFAVGLIAGLIIRALAGFIVGMIVCAKY